MHTASTKNRFLIFFLVLSLALLVSVLAAQPAKANGADPESECENAQGIWNPSDQTCTLREEDWGSSMEISWDRYAMIVCGNTTTSVIVFQWDGATNLWSVIECRHVGPRPLESRCKLDEVDGSSVIGMDYTIKATFRGPGNYLRLWSGEQYYRLPVVPGTLQYLSDGLWTASFRTTDPLSGEALAPPGKYKVQCFGPSGTAGGTGAVTLTK